MIPDRDFLEALLRKCTDSEFEQLRIISTEEEYFCRPGDSYTSNLVALSVKYQTHLSDKKEVKWVIKRPFGDENLSVMMSSDKAFSNEAVWYKRAMPLFRGLGLGVPECLHASTGLIVLEELHRKGFKLACRQRGLDPAHLKLALQELAKIHGASIKLRHEQPDLYGDIVGALQNFRSQNEFFAKVFDLSIRRASTKLRDLGMMEEAENLSQYSAPTFLKFTDTLPEEPFFTAICHGDFWSNNILFRDDKKSVQVVDFQCVQEGPIVRDILTLTETSRDLTNDEDDRPLYEAYYNSLREALDGLTGLPDLSSFLRHLASYRLFGLLVSIFFIAPVVIQEDQIRSLAVMTKESFFKEELYLFAKSRPYQERLLFIVQRYKRLGLL